MATSNGDIKTPETAQTFAKDYVHVLLDDIKNSGAFEEETLDLTIKSKYDDLVVDESETESQSGDKSKTEGNAEKEVANGLPEEKTETFQVETVKLNGQEDSCVPEQTEQIPQMTQQNNDENADEQDDHFVVHVVDNSKTIQEDYQGESEISGNVTCINPEIDASIPLEPQNNGSELVEQTKEEITIHLIGHGQDAIDASVPLEPQNGESKMVDQNEHQDHSAVDKSIPLEPQNDGSEMVDQNGQLDHSAIDTSVPLEPQNDGSEMIDQNGQLDDSAIDTSVPPEPQVNGSEMIEQTPGLVTAQLTSDAKIARHETNNIDEGEEEDEEGDVLPPISQPTMTRAIDPDELKLNKIGVNDNLWASKRATAATEKEESIPHDKFRTIKQNIKKGNTRSLKERFENFGKF